MSASTTKQHISTPVLLIIFNRPTTTRLVFEAIREARPEKLYVAADGPRPDVSSDIINCAEAREIINDVDWPCEVKTLFRDKNINCGLAPSSAISWFFEYEEEGIILEDDCLPNQSFFQFCHELLLLYRNDTRVMHIGGNNFLDGWRNDPDYSYYFSRSGHIWGWATWKRAWKMFDYKISLYNELKESNYFEGFFLNPLEKFYRLRKFDKTIASQKIDWWDYQWDFARYINSGLSIVPNSNMVTNIGFGEDATHTQNGNSKSAKMDMQELEFPLKHPPYLIRDLASEKKYFKKFMLETLRSKFESITH